MARALTRHSRLVFWLKIALPILALAILSTMFLFARRIDFEGALPYAEVDIDALANDPRLTRPEFSGTTDDGAAITVAAETARPGKAANDPMTAEDVIAVYQSESGTRITLQAKSGSFENAQNSLTLTGDVVVTTSDGYKLRSQEMVSALDATEVTSAGPVNGSGPFGQLEAGGMKLSGAPDDQTVVFNKGVRLIYQPKN